MMRDDDEPGVLQQVGVQHALVHRAVPEHLDDGPQLWRHQSRIQQFGHLGGMPERFECSRAAANEVADHRRDQVPRQPVGIPTGLDPE